MSQHNRAKRAERKWEPLAPATPIDNSATRSLGLDLNAMGDCFKNHLYTVFRKGYTDNMGRQFVHLSIRRNDREPCRDWRHFQRIKNELCGPEWEGLELYPKESRAIDTANQYHLWCVEWEIPFGWATGERSDTSGVPNTKQRKGAKLT